MCAGADQEAEPSTPGTCTAIAGIFVIADGEPCTLPEMQLCEEGLFRALETLTATEMTMTCTAEQAEPGGSCFLASWVTHR